MSATSKTLGTLHELFAQYWMDRMTQKVEVYNSDGEVIDTKVVPLTAAEASVLRAFLKDNNVAADPDANKDVESLGAALRAATAGEVSTTEMDAILADFQNVLGGTAH